MSFSGKKLLVVGLVISLLVGIPLTVYLVQQQQNNQSHASASSTLTFVPATVQSSPIQKNVGDTIPLDITIDPGKNIVQSITLDIIYDPAALSVDPTNGFTQDQTAKANLPSISKGPTYTPGRINVTLSTVGIGADIASGIKTFSKVGTVTFKALAPTTSTQVTFSEQTNALSVAGIATGSNDSYGENVLLPPVPAFIAIGNGTVPTSTPAISGTITPTPTISGTITPTPTTQAVNQTPVCTALNVDRSVTGTAPLALTFTAVGSDTDGTVSKATFNFGDGPTQDVTTGGGLGTKSVSVQLSHQFNNAGTYPISVLLTDNAGGLSNRQSCTQTVVVSPAAARSGGTTGLGSGTSATPTATLIAAAPTAIPTAAPLTRLPNTGPGDKFIVGGSAVAIITLLGGILFLAL